MYTTNASPFQELTKTGTTAHRLFFTQTVHMPNRTSKRALFFLKRRVLQVIKHSSAIIWKSINPLFLPTDAMQEVGLGYY